MNTMRLSIPVTVLLCLCVEPSSSFSYGLQTSIRTFGTTDSYGLTKGLRDTSLAETPEPLETDSKPETAVDVEIAIPEIMATIRAAENDAREARMAARTAAQTPNDATNDIAPEVLDATMNIITSENDARKALLAELMAAESKQ
mmetsp:Transcript_8467/g.8632  ORF Transcript_8467/g.8632 Transcript_8467/m.8632 type:complete len:144 (-) Transcript_8467:336-767(-)